MNKTETKSGVLLKHHLKALKLPTMHAECEKIAQRCAAGGCHLLIEKPLAASAEGIAALEATLAARGIRAAVARRYRRAVKR